MTKIEAPKPIDAPKPINPDRSPCRGCGHVYCHKFGCPAEHQ